jgi:hypothetical protein
MGTPLRVREITQVDCWRLQRLIVGYYQVFTMRNPLRVCEITQVDCWILHRLVVGDYTVFAMGNPLRDWEITQVDCWRLHRLILEITQVDCWWLHSFHWGKSLKVLEITQADCWRLHRLIDGDYTVFLAEIAFLRDLLMEWNRCNFLITGFHRLPFLGCPRMGHDNMPWIRP